MKKRIALVILALALIVSLIGCFTGASMVGTNWTYEVLGVGIGLKFNTETAGTTTAGVLGIWADAFPFTYTYNSTALSGTITMSGDTTSSPFTVSGTTLTWNSTTYNLK